MIHKEPRGSFFLPMDTEPSCEVRCPTCFESFTVNGPGPSEVPTEWDYDCEICCRPMLIRFEALDGCIDAQAEPAD